jgi:16S rRNA (guanine1207-N2)-methyltransferase
MSEAVYGAPPLKLAGAQGLQLSPLVPGSAALEALEPQSLDAVTVLAPAGVIERRYVLAAALQALKVGGDLTAMAPKAAGGTRLKAELQAFGVEAHETFKAHHRICVALRPAMISGIDEALAAGGPQQLPDGLWTQPGVFSWDRLDPGSALLLATLPPLAGKGADLGCGIGVLAQAVLKRPKVERLTMIDLDRRAVEAARRNVTDARAEIAWGDVRTSALADLDFVVCNPPFHVAGKADLGLGAAFIDAASAGLRRGGSLWLVANRQLPYEAVLTPRFSSVTLKAQTGLYKVYEARR